MGYRRFVDQQGRTWEAWEVRPGLVERRMNSDRRRRPRDTPDRRRRREFRLSMPPELQGGWLAFQAAKEKFRVAPIPEGWVHLSDDELARLIETTATRSSRRFGVH